MVPNGRKLGTAAILVYMLALLPTIDGPVAWAQELVIHLTIQNHQFSPAVIEAPAGKKFTLIVKNADATAEEFESEELKREKVIPPGGEVTLHLGPLMPGTYGFFGEFNPKTAQGKLIVK